MIPVITIAVAAGFDKCGELRIGHRCTRHAEGRDFHGMPPFFIVEDEMSVIRSTQMESATGNFDISVAVTGFDFGNLPTRAGITMCLPGIGQCLAMHFLMQRAELGEIMQIRIVSMLPQLDLDGGADASQHAQGVRYAGQRQIPARSVRHCSRVIQCIRIRRQVATGAIPFTQTPALFKPAQVPDLPQRRVDDSQPGPEPLLRFEQLRQGQRAFARRIQHGQYIGVRQRLGNAHDFADLLYWVEVYPDTTLMKIALITPASPKSRYGNRNTAVRWAELLRELGHEVSVQESWNGHAVDAMLALHARRSHDSVIRFVQRWPERPLIVALTGTDLYRDIRTDANAQESLELATRLIVLQDMGPRELPARLRRKTRVIYQSCEPIARKTALKSCFEIIVSGHLREEKDPFRGAAALEYLPAASRIRITHIGGARDPLLATEARRWMQRQPRYVWLDELARSKALTTLARGRAMLLSSHMEGGANVISEALTARVPVIASRIPGNIGMLGKDYRGYYPPGDARALARLLWRIESDDGFLGMLRRQCAVRRRLISRVRERGGLRKLFLELAKGKQ